MDPELKALLRSMRGCSTVITWPHGWQLRCVLRHPGEAADGQYVVVTPLAVMFHGVAVPLDPWKDDGEVEPIRVWLRDCTRIVIVR